MIDELDFTKLSKLSFATPDTDTFALLRCATECIGRGGALPAVLNAANEVAVAAFLDRRLSFYGITESVLRVVDELSCAASEHSLDGILGYEKEARERAELIIAK